jgi:sulfonate transport system permease protein
LQSGTRHGFAMGMRLDTIAAAKTDIPIGEAASRRLGGHARPLLGLLLPLGLALAWEITVWLGLSSGRLVPPPSRIFFTILELARSGELTLHVTATMTRVIAGFGLGVAAGTILGAISGYWDLARRLLDPTVQALRAIPSLAWVPLFILWLGIFETSKVALIAAGIFFPVYLGVMGAILSVDRRRSRPHLPPLRAGDDPAHPVARGLAGLRRRAAGWPRTGMDVRGRR